MSRIYKHPITVPTGIVIIQHKNSISFSNTISTITRNFHLSVEITQIENTIVVKPMFESREAKMHSATVGRIIRNIIMGFITPFTRTLKLVGVGYKANMDSEQVINFSLNFSHPMKYHLPEMVTAKCASPTEIILSSIDKELLGRASSEIRALRSPEPYKGKGVLYSNEIIIIKTPKKK